MGKVFFISDQHHGHDNGSHSIIKYESRPFKDAEEMDNILINNWNSVINSNDDKTFILGDLTFYNKEKSKEIMEQLKGYKILIVGSHDHNHSISWYRDIGISEVYKYPIIYKKFWICSHEPLYMNDSMPYCNIHGHLHSKKINSKQYFNVSVECINYTPIDFEEIKKQVMGEEKED